MERMEAYAAPAGIENRVCQQMVKINQHSKDENNICVLPFWPKEEISNCEWKDEVKEIMDYLLHTLRATDVALRQGNN